MKKFFAMLLTLTMVLAIAGCGKTGLGSGWASSDDSITVTDFDDGTHLYEGRIDSTMKTAWFDFTITDAYITEDAIGGYTPSDGNVLVVVSLTLKNTFSESVPMSNWDFQLQWGDDADDAFSMPVETNEDLMDDQFPAEYSLKVNETKKGVLIFEAPEGEDDFSISFIEYYEDDTEGDYFWVYFSADER